MDLPSVIQADLHEASEALRAAKDSDKYDMVKFIKNGAEEFVVGVDPIKARN